MKRTQQTPVARKKKVAKKGLNSKSRKQPLRKLTRMNARSTISHPYLACISGPSSMSPMGVGFPDGNPNKSIVVDFKQVVTITPTAGKIRFALVSSPYGCLAMGAGTVSGTILLPQYAASPSLSYSWASVTAPNINSANWYILPFQENADYQVDGENMGPYKTGQYRGLVTMADISFTGSTMANGGVVTVYKTTPNIVDKTEDLYNGVNVSQKDVTDLNVAATVGTVSGRYTGAARVPITVRSASAKPEYRPTWENTVNTEILPWSLTSAGTTTGGLSPGFDNSVPITVVDYSGLDASASVTIELRSCLELVPRVGTMAAFAKPSPPASLAAWEKVANFVRNLPAAQIARGVAGGITGYATGGIAGGLHGMAMAF